MMRYQRYLWVIIPAVMLVTAMQPAFAQTVELSVNDSITLALKNNYDIKYAQSAREKSYWAMNEAKKNKGLSLNVTHTDQRYNTPPEQTGTGTYSYTTKFDNQIALTLPLYSGGKLEGQIEQAKLNLQVAELDIDAAKQQLKLEIVSDYLTVLEYRNEVKVNQETVKNYEEHLKLVQAKFDLGMVAKTDVLSSQVDLASAQNDLIKAQNNYTNAVAALNNAIGLPHTTEVVLKDDFSYEKYAKTLEECLQYAMDHRPELAQQEAKIASAQYAVDVAKSGQRPTVNLTAEQDWYDSHLVGTKNSNWLVKVTTSLNVFDSGVTNVAKMVNGGDTVYKGQPLFQIDNKQYQSAIVSARASMNKAQATLNNTQKDVDRYEKLGAIKGVAQQTVDAYRSQAEEEAAAVEVSRASLQQAMQDEQDTLILSPVDGRIDVNDVSQGYYVAAGSTVMATVSSIDPVWVQFSMSETEYLKYIRSGNGQLPATFKEHLQLILSDGKEYPVIGRVEQIDRGVSDTTGTITFKASFDNPQKFLLPGMFARVVVQEDLRKGALLIPQKAVKQVLDNTFVIVVTDDNKAESRQVKLGSKIGDMWLVEEGLSDTDRVVVEGIDKVKQGTDLQVTMLQPDAQTPAKQ